MVTGINKIAGALAALTITGLAMPVVAQADDWHERRDRAVVRDDRRDGRRDFRVVGGPVYRPAVVVAPGPFFRPAPIVVTPVCPPVVYVAPGESLQDRKNDARNVATVGLAATALGIVTHNRTLTAVGAVGAIAGGAQFERDQQIQNERSNW